MLVSWKPRVSLVIFTFGALLRSGAPFEGNLACRVTCREQIQFYQLYCRGSPSLSCPSVLLLISSYFCLLPTEIWFKATEVLLLGLLPCSEWQLFAAGTGAPSLSAPNCLPAASFRPSAGSARAAASPPEQKHARYFQKRAAGECLPLTPSSLLRGPSIYLVVVGVLLKLKLLCRIGCCFSLGLFTLRQVRAQMGVCHLQTARLDMNLSHLKGDGTL